MSPERETPIDDVFPLGLNAVQEAVYWAHANLVMHENVVSETSNLKGESLSFYDFLQGMTTLRNAFSDPSYKAIVAYEKGFLFMLEALYQQANEKNIALHLPDSERIMLFFNELLNLEYNAPQIDEVKRALFKDQEQSIPKFVGAMIEMDGTRPVEILKESIRNRTDFNTSEMLAKEKLVGKAFGSSRFQRVHGPIYPFQLGATDVYYLFTPIEPKVDVEVLNRMWDVEIR